MDKHPQCEFLAQGDHNDCATAGGGRGAPLSDWCKICLVSECEKLRESLKAINTLRSCIIATQRAGWSNLVYPLVAILDNTGFELFEPSEEQVAHYFATYGGAGGYPGHELSTPRQEDFWAARRVLKESIFQKKE